MKDPSPSPAHPPLLRRRRRRGAKKPSILALALLVWSPRRAAVAFRPPSAGAAEAAFPRPGPRAAATPPALARPAPRSRLRAAPSPNGDERADEARPSAEDDPERARDRVRRKIRRASMRVRDAIGLGATEGGSPVAGVLADAAAGAAELAAEEVRAAALEVLLRGRSSSGTGAGADRLEGQARAEADAQATLDAVSLAKTSVADAFAAADDALAGAEAELRRAREALTTAKRDAALGLAVAEKAAAGAAARASSETEAAVRAAERAEASMGGGAVAVEVLTDAEGPAEADATTREDDEKREEEEEEEEEENAIGEGTADLVDALSDFDPLSYALAEMGSPFLGEDECLVPGEPLVRVERAPRNSRRIFAGIDIPVSVEDVWKLLTDYENLGKVVPNLVVNEVLELYEGEKEGVGAGGAEAGDGADGDDLPPAAQCRLLASRMKGAVLRQVGSAKVVGINFSARTTLEVREWPAGMPDFAHHEDEVYDGKSRSERARESAGRELARHVFPRPFALSSLPHKDISMQSVEDDDGEFRMYQGVWRMQPLPGCSPPGGDAMRLTYAVEVSPRPYLPVALVEGRIARDLCSNLEAIRDMFAT
ncbi:hypothetical protein ACHAWF_016093 [Thalassiosira exigua]